MFMALARVAVGILMGGQMVDNLDRDPLEEENQQRSFTQAVLRNANTTNC